MTRSSYELTYRGKSPEDEVLSTPALPLNRIKAIRGPADWRNILISGDNLNALASLLEMKRSGQLKSSDGTPGAKFVYIDPPFSTNLEFRGKESQKAYKDKVLGAEFIEFLRKRLILLREVLSPDGSIFVHLDWKKAHYIKAVMDEVFGEENFLNDIIWSYGGRGAKAIAGQFSRNHDIILWYRRGEKHTFNQLAFEKAIPKKGSGFKQDEVGRWFKTSPRGDYTDESIRALEKEGRIYRTRNGTVRIKYFLREEGDFLLENKLVGDVWDDIPDAMHLSAAEKTGYPTQKPEALLARIISAASNPGDLVLDAFAGAGTTLAVAEKLGRRWAGVDSGALSIHTIQKRLLSIKNSKHIEKPAKRYGKACSPFEIFSICPEEYDCGCGGERGPDVKCRYSIDESTGECVVKIERLKSPGARQGAGLDALSSVALDMDFNGDVLHIDSFHTNEELREKGFELRFPLKEVKGAVMLVFSDICGNEKWFLGELA